MHTLTKADADTRWTPMMIFALDDDLDAHILYDRAAQLGFTVKRMQGCYAGETETSYLIPLAAHDVIHDLITRQESILVLTPQAATRKGNRTAYLEFADGLRVPLGEFRKVPEAYARELDAWTRDETTGDYWVAETVDEPADAIAVS